MNTIIYYGVDDISSNISRVRSMITDIRDLLYGGHKRSALFLDAQHTLVAPVYSHSRRNEIMVVSVHGDYRWNPIHDPESLPSELASRVIAVYRNLIGNTGIDDLKVEIMFQLLASAIGLHRLVFGYGTLNDVVNTLQYDKNSIAEIYISKWYRTKLSLSEHIEFRKYYRYLINSYSLPGRADAVNTLVSMLDIFTREDIAATFCPAKEDINFTTDDAVKNNKVVILYAATHDYGLFPQTLGIMMKLAYQASVLKFKANCGLVMGDYQDFISDTDEEFFRLATDCRTICTTPGRSSLVMKVGEEKTNKILSHFNR